MNSVVNSRKRKKQRRLKAKLLEQQNNGSIREKTEDEEESEEEETAILDPKRRAQRLNTAGWDEQELGFTIEDLDKTIAVLESLGRNITAFKGSPFKILRGALHPLIQEQMKNYDLKGTLKRKRKDIAELQSLKEQDKEWINKSALRAKRLASLEELNQVEASGETLMITHMGEVHEVLEKFKVGRVADGVAELDAAEEVLLQTESKRLNVPKPCYTCKRPFVDLHFFYDQLCPSCAALNYSKRNEMVDLSGRVAIVTGARVKIGYRASLKLLRCGCTVIATSRFASDCAKRYSEEPDFNEWKSRLQCYGIDFRDLAALEQFCAWIISKYTRLDILINNACQTIRRPAHYYSHLMSAERRSIRDLPSDLQQLLHDNEAFHSAAQQTSGRFITPARSEIDIPSAFIQPLEASEGCSSDVHGESGEARPAASPRCSTSDSSMEHSHRHVEAPVGKSSNKGCSKSESTCDASVAPAQPPRHNCDREGTTTATLPAVRAAKGSVVENGEGRAGRWAAEMSQMVVLEEDAVVRPEAFPVRADGAGALLDVNGQQVDLRKSNSWMLKLHEVSTGELAEVMAINAIAPAVLNARLKGLLEASPEDWTFIVNVSAMEGKFYRWKTEQHPHTNMAKASLNMMTRTSAQDYVKSGIYMTAVDTGWINDEKPMDKAAAHGARHGFQTPLDEVDAAARVLDPIIAPLAARARAAAAAGGGEAVEEPVWGVFLKDFVKCEW